jgi:hypothetical protein
MHRLPAWHSHIRKQLVKAPKLHFFDTGLLCYLLGIREPGQLRLHPLRGAIFESWVVSEIYKARVHQGSEASMFHYRETRGLEIDCLIDRGDQLDAIEIKSGETFSTDYLKNLRRYSERVSGQDRIRKLRSYVVYGGDLSQQRSNARLLSWREITELMD